MTTMEITSDAIPPTMPPTRTALFELLASESEFCGLSVTVGVEEEVLEKLEGVVVEMAVELPVELVVEELDGPLEISTPGPISGLPKNVGVKRPKTSEEGKFLPPRVLESLGFQLFLSCYMLSISVRKKIDRNVL